MSTVTNDIVVASLKKVIDPKQEKDIITLGLVKQIEITDNNVSCVLELNEHPKPLQEELKGQAIDALLEIQGVSGVNVEISAQVRASRTDQGLVIEGVKNIIPIASAKGGVGKSTVSVNLAIALAKKGARVGLMDGDVYGPSVPMLMGITEEMPGQNAQQQIVPVEKYGIKTISMGLLVPGDRALIWRGPMLNKMISQFLKGVQWGELDYLLIDLPPGTGDVQLTLCQQVALTGAVIVSTPQIMALNITKKAAFMFEQLNSPLIGFVENMSFYECSKCGNKDDIFGTQGTRQVAEEFGVPLLGQIPISTQLRDQADQGLPILIQDENAPTSKEFLKIADTFLAQLAALNQSGDINQDLKVTVENETDIKIQWSPKEETVYPGRFLRLACQCARCVDEMSGEPLLVPKTVPMDVKPSSIKHVGSYAIQVWWSDGHSTGIYPFKELRKMTPPPTAEAFSV